MPLGVGVFSHIVSDRTRNNELRLYQVRFRLDIKNKILHQKSYPTLEKAANSGGRVIIPEGIKKTPWFSERIW